MADYSTISASIEAALTEVAESGVEEYEIGTNRRRVKRPNILDLVKARMLLAGAESRASHRIFHLAKPKNPQ